MYMFWSDLIEPLLKIIKAKKIVEIGSDYGYNTKNILQYCVEHDAELICVDPFPKYEPSELNAQYENRMTLHKELSLNVLGLIHDYDVILLDGDHNWYTVYNELKLIERNFKTKEKFPLVLLHDVSWPYDRRDLYYNPANIPDAFRHPYEKKGMLPNEFSLVESNKACINSHLCNSIYVNNLKNGVLTALEDFLSETEFKLNIVDFKTMYGIAVVFTEDASVSSFLASDDLCDNLLKLTERYRIESLVKIEEHKLKNEKLKGKYTQMEATANQLKDDNEQLNIDNEKLSVDNEKLKGKYTQMEAAANQLNDDNEQLNIDNEQLSVDNGQLKVKAEQLKDEFNRMKVKAKNEEFKIRELQMEKTQLKSNFDARQFELKSEINHIEGSIRYRIGTALVDATGSFTDTVKLPVRLFRLFRESRLKSPQDASISRRKSSAVPASSVVEEKKTSNPIIFEQYLTGLESRKYGKNAAVDVIVCVHNALEDVKACLCSLYEKKTLHFNLIIVDDGSDDETYKFLQSFSKRFDAKFIRNDIARGYTCAANQGLKISDNDYAVLLNSDTIVTRSWLEKMIVCMNSTPNTGIVGPLSNAASWQTVPQIFDGGDWKVNTLPDKISIEMMAAIVEASSEKTYISMPFINGFCFMIKREVINKIGYLDEETFPTGYGEENDYCIRAHNAGFELRIADDCYIFHEKSKSFTHDKRKILSKKASEKLQSKYNSELIKSKVDVIKSNSSLAGVREKIAQVFDEVIQSEVFSKRILFMLPVGGGGGGAHSVVQEVIGLNELGINARISNHKKHQLRFLQNYPEAETLVDFYTFTDEDLGKLCRDYDVIVSTVYHSVRLLSRIKSIDPRIIACYYIQDYEPYFFDESNEETRLEAVASYEIIPDINGFAKTEWLCNIVKDKHDMDVYKVSPSLDTMIYNPLQKRELRSNHPIVISAMIRPNTARRFPFQTFSLLHRAKEYYGTKVEIRIFGCEDNALHPHPKYNEFEFINCGVLKREEVVSLLEDADIFIDMSEYQAFGRTGLEAMAMGCATILPVKGGTHEYCESGENCFLVDTKSEDDVFDALKKIVDDSDLMFKLKSKGLSTAHKYSVRKAAWSEYQFLNSLYSPPPHKITVCAILQSFSKGSTNVRILRPYFHKTLKNSISVKLFDSYHEKFGNIINQLKTEKCDILLIQRTAIPLECVNELITYCKTTDVKILLEIDDDLINIDKTHLEYKKFKAFSESIKKIAKNARAITVSTVCLKEVMKDYGNAVVIPNYIDESVWISSGTRKIKDNQTNKVVLGYIGTPTHGDDIKMLEGIVSDAKHKLMAEAGIDLSFEVIGGLNKGEQWFKHHVVPKDCEVYTLFAEYVKKNTEHWDFVVAPLLDTPLNRAKSAIKYLEYSVLKLAGIYSDIGEYSKIVKSNETGILITNNDKKEWISAICEMAKSNALRKKLSQNAYEHVTQNYLLKQNAINILPVLQGILK